MTRLSSRVLRKPKAARESQTRATLVFRDFVRQLEKLDARASDPKVGTTFGINPMLPSLMGASLSAENRSHFSARCDRPPKQVRGAAR